MLASGFGLRRGDVLSVIGAGGKTTLIYRLARELSDFKVLVTTTTRMYFPGDDEADHVFINEAPKPTENGIYFLSGTPDTGEAENTESKPPGGRPHKPREKATPYPDLHSVIRDFDITLIEADGAKGKLLKGWAAHEPVIISETTKTLCVLNFATLGLPATPGSIHRFDEYLRMTRSKPGDTVTVEHLRSVAEEMFSKAAGEKILCVAQGEDKPYKLLTNTNLIKGVFL